MKIKNYIFTLLVLVLGFYSCNKDDDGADTSTVVLRDRAEQYLVDIDSIEEYLSTHFYNYEEFNADPSSSSFQIEFDTINGVNIDKIPLIDQVDYKTVYDFEDVEYKLYYLKVREGEGEQPTFADSTYISYKGNMLNDEDIFDSRINPIWLPIHFSVQGFKETMVEFKGAVGFEVGDDGTTTFEDFGIGAMFIPSGLAYYAGVTPGESYAPLIFTFKLFRVNQADDDNDGLLNVYEDLDDDRDLYSDDTDEDLIPNFLDVDDDGDGLVTIKELDFNEYIINIGENDPTFASNELEIDREIDEDAGTITIDTVVVLDTNDDGIPDYLDEDTTIEE